jgi:hypothetical protein
MSDERTVLRLMITLATHCQGGHSRVGHEVADLLGIPFPLNMENLSRAAVERGFDPGELWPWLKEMSAPRPALMHEPEEASHE